MPVIVFIIDNSASMNQMTYLGTSYLDIAKSAIENFLKIRSRDQMNSRNDRYMLLTLDEPPSNIKVGWKEHMSIFTNELKNLKALGLTNINPVLKQAFDLLNLNRLSSGMDTFGMGRCPFYLEPSLIIFITDGAQLMDVNSAYDEVTLPLTNCPLGSELTVEPFKWDQRFFLISLNMGSMPVQENNQNTFIPYAFSSPINSMCEVTGGRSYLISTQRMLYQCLESLVSKIQAGVVINFEKFGNDPPALKTEPESAQMLNDRIWEKCRKMIFIPRNQTKGYAVGHWPIPEDYWLSLNSQTLPKRSAHPLVKFKCEPCEPLVIEELPFDRYELEPSPLTQFILERRQPNIAWQCYVPNSGNKINELGSPFGYLKASGNLMSVNLFVMPYNYPVLFQLITELFQVLKLKPTKAWTDKFDLYLKNIPPYYYAPLRRALSKKGLQHLIAENLENCLSFQVQNYLKKIKNQAKISFDQVNAQPTIPIETISLLSSNPNCILNKRQLNDSYVDSREFNSWLQSHSDPLRADLIRQQFNDFGNFLIYVRERRKQVSFKDPGEIQRKNLIESLQKMRGNFFNKCKHADEDELHSVPIQDMGNYHEYLKNQVQPLRELETPMVRQHMFGNPFKLVSKDQKTNMFGADEIDEVYEESTENNNQFQQQQQKTIQAQQAQQQQPSTKRPGTPGSVASGASSVKRRAVKGPLSRRVNYMKNLYSSNSSSVSSSALDSEVEFIDDSSVASGFSSLTSFNGPNSAESPDVKLDKSNVSITSDVANLNDFNDISIINEIDMQQADGSKPANQPRPVSAASLLSSNEADSNMASANLALCDNFIEQSYIQTKILCIEQIKRSGLEHSQLFKLIHEAPLTFRMKTFLIKELIYEAVRFKRSNLALHLTKFAMINHQIYQANSASAAASSTLQASLTENSNSKDATGGAKSGSVVQPMDTNP